MKRIIFIILLFVSVTVQAQIYENKYNDVHLISGGDTIVIQAEFIIIKIDRQKNTVVQIAHFIGATKTSFSTYDIVRIEHFNLENVSGIAYFLINNTTHMPAKMVIGDNNMLVFSEGEVNYWYIFK